MTERSFFIIQNPAAGRGSARGAWLKAQHALDRAGVRYEVAMTEAPRHAEALAERASHAGWSAVVAVGGDGTVQEVANGLMHAAGDGPTIPLGVIGLGSGNDFIKLLDLPQGKPVAAVERLLASEPRSVDIGRIGGRYFTNGVGVGFDARIAIEASKIQRLRGIAIYGWALLRVLRSLHAPPMRVTLDGKELGEERRTLVTVSNGACHGGGFWICPNARVDDGLLDVCIADELRVHELIPLIPRLMRGTHTTHSAVHMHRARQIQISSSSPLPVHADGEILAESAHELEIELLPGRLTVLA